MPITFGSVGDIIAVCILVKDCVEALSDTNGSAPQYQAVIRELHILEKALLEVGVLSRTHATTPELIALFTSADTTIEQCRKALELFKAKTQPYDQHLGDSSTNTTVQKLYKGNAKKLLWQVRMKDEVARFRAEVVAYSVSIDKILAAATMHTIKAQADRLDSRVEDLQRENQRSFSYQDEMLKEIRSRLDEVDRRNTAGNSLIIKLAKNARKTWLIQLGNELKALMLNTVAINLAIYASVDKVHESILDLRRALPTSNPLYHPLQERKFYLIDAIGRQSTITLDWIDSYDALTAVLQVRFQGKPGIKKILKNEYAIQSRATGKDMDMTKPWESFFLPGLYFYMSMIFQIVQDEETRISGQDACPRCGARSNQPQGLEIICSVCSQEYQYDRSSEFTMGSTTLEQKPTYTYAPDAPESHVNAPHPTYKTWNSDGPLVGPRESESGPDPDDDPANFNHVRIKTRAAQSQAAQLKLSETPKNPTGFASSSENSSVFMNHSNANHYSDEYDSDNSSSSTPSRRISVDTTELDTKHGTSTADDEANENAAESTKAIDAADVPSEEYLTRKEGSQSKRITQKKASEKDARRAGIPAGYSYRHWDPSEEPIFLLGSVFDANSLGKWVYDWTVFHKGPGSSLTLAADELWLLLIQLASKIKRAEQTIPRIVETESYGMIEDFLESGERLWIRLARLLKQCEDYMMEAVEIDDEGNKTMGKKSTLIFVDALFGKARELEKTEKLMTGLRLWTTRFDTHCDDILRQHRLS